MRPFSRLNVAMVEIVGVVVVVVAIEVVPEETEVQAPSMIDSSSITQPNEELKRSAKAYRSIFTTDLVKMEKPEKSKTFLIMVQITCDLKLMAESGMSPITLVSKRKFTRVTQEP